MFPWLNLPARPEYLYEKFATTDDGCVVWLGGMDKDGYGLMASYKKTRFNWRTHRLALALHYNALIPSHVLVRHTCSNAGCGYFGHLLLGQAQDNHDDYTTQNPICKQHHPIKDEHWTPYVNSNRRSLKRYRYCDACQPILIALKANWR